MSKTRRKVVPAPVVEPTSLDAENDSIPAEVIRLAERLGLEAVSLLAWKVYPQGKVVLVAANGMKFSAEEGPHEPQSEARNA